MTIFSHSAECENELNSILETVNDAWNYFPRKILNGFSPEEKLLECHKQQEKKR